MPLPITRSCRPAKSPGRVGRCASGHCDDLNSIVQKLAEHGFAGVESGQNHADIALSEFVVDFNVGLTRGGLGKVASGRFSGAADHARHDVARRASRVERAHDRGLERRIVRREGAYGRFEFGTG